MIEREIAVVVSNANREVNVFDTIDAIQNAGFKNVFIQWYNRDWNPTQEEQLRYIKEKGLNVIFAHLGYQNINSLWLDNEEGGNKLVERYKCDIKICKENDIPMVVMHLTGKDEVPRYNKIGIKRLQEIADYAKALDMKVAFENTKHKGYLDYVIENIKSENVGICFDSGHYHVHFGDDLDFAKFKDRIFAVHLHDNDKSEDLHLMPFDGTIDWKQIIKDLKNCNYSGPITMELCYRYDYLAMSIDNFYKKGYEIGEKLKEMFEEVSYH
ncbi:MAG: sugar phosphate isomerase/epimerase [Acetatifactor sp.]|nr:sugar phosphate isomerase/epimerase [Acetatifactor sp.]